MLINKTNIVGLAIASALWSQIAVADTVEVKAVVTKFEPEVAFIKPGDSVKFTNMAGHDTVAIEGMIPEGAEAVEIGDERRVQRHLGQGGCLCL